MRIFDSEKVAELVKSWLDTQDKDTLNTIIEETRLLAKYIAARYDSQNTDDLVQDALMKVMASLAHYNPDVANIHTYFSTVIRNSCITHYVKVKNYSNSESLCLDDVENSILCQTIDLIDDDCEVQELVLRNIERFPSLSSDLVTQTTLSIYYLTRDGIRNKSRGIVSNLVKNFKISRVTAKILYRSTITHMRMQYISNSQVQSNAKIPELSLLPELKEFLGDEQYIQFICVFSGTTLNIK